MSAFHRGMKIVNYCGWIQRRNRQNDYCCPSCLLFLPVRETLLVDGDPNRSATGWSKRGAFPFKVVDLMQAALYSPKYEHIVIDTAARSDEYKEKENNDRDYKEDR